MPTPSDTVLNQQLVIAKRLLRMATECGCLPAVVEGDVLLLCKLVVDLDERLSRGEGTPAKWRIQK